MENDTAMQWLSEGKNAYLNSWPLARIYIYLLQKSKDFKEAMSQCDEWAERKKEDLSADYWNLKGQIYMKMEISDLALDCFRQAVMDDQNGNPDYVYDYVTQLKDMDRREEALQYALDWMTDKGANGVLNFRVAQLYAYKDEYNKAKEYYAETISYYPENCYYADFYLICLQKLGEHAEGITFAENWLKKNEPDAIFLNRVGTLYDNQKELKEALRYYKKAAELDKSRLTYVLNTMECLIEMKKYKDALEFGKSREIFFC